MSRHEVEKILARVAAEGDAALLDYTARFDRQQLRPEQLRIGAGEIAAALERCPPELRDALELAAERIGAFHRKQLPPALDHRDDLGVRLALCWRPIAAVGIYVPGGTAAYPSSVLMNALPARIAGVPRLAMVVPAPGGALNPLVLIAAHLAGVDEIYRVGGAQAIAALAFGTASIRKVDKIVGPGNAWVAEAKRQVFGRVGIDMIAGPSEIVVVADGAQDPEWVAADLLSQAEHDELAQAILITDSEGLAAAVAAAVTRQLEALPRRRNRRRQLAGPWRDHRLAAPGRRACARGPPGAGAPRAAGRRARGHGRAHTERRRHLPWRPYARGDRRLRRRAQPRPADRSQRPLRVGPVGLRLPEADHAARLPGERVRGARAGGGGARARRRPRRPRRGGAAAPARRRAG